MRRGAIAALAMVSIATGALAQSSVGPSVSVKPSVSAAGVPLMTIKIFNDDPDNHYIFPVLTTGKGAVDIWLQAIFKVPKAREKIDIYGRTKNYRIYINDTFGIAPGKGVSLTLPLYTQLVAKVNPTKTDQYIDWWNGGTIQLYSSPTSAAPKALVDAMKSTDGQQQVKPVAGAALPTCSGCRQAPSFYSEHADLPKNDPSQLLEYTLGARVELKVKNPATDPQNTLDLRNVDFDVSYVNLGYMPAVMGPLANDQVGYVGTPQSINAYQNAMKNFLVAFPGWPRFVKTYADGSKETINKLPSPLEIFSRLVGGSLPPPDLEPVPGKWPTQLWTPIQALRTNWVRYAGKVTADGGNLAGECKATATRDTFCDGVVEIKKLLIANYKNYRAVFPSQCSGRAVNLSDDLMIAHVYGWSPFTEAVYGSGTGCGAKVNLMQASPGYSANNFAEYVRVKLLFDKINYGTLKSSKYTFNPWVTFIHGAKFVNAPNVYAYSVDDAVGNIQAEGLGFIVDVGSTKHLENQLPAAPPITVNYAIGDPLPIRMTRYRLCKDDVAHERPVNPNFAAFVINAADPGKCPIYFFDNKSVPQKYTFRVTRKPPYKLFSDPATVPPRWMPETSKPIDCSGNAGAPYKPSSKTWCCDKSASNGVFAFSTPEPASAHQALLHNVILHAPEQSINTTDQACNLTPP